MRNGRQAGRTRTCFFLPSDSFIDAFGREIGEPSPSAVVGDRLVVEADGAALDVAARFAVRCRKPGGHEQRQDADAGFESCLVDFHGRQGIGGRAFLECLARGLRRLFAAARPCTIAVASVASTFFASLISEPPSAASRLISSSGRRVKIFRKRSTSASSVLRQYCQKS